MQDKRKINKKLIGTLILIAALASYFFSYFIISLFKNNFKLVLTADLLLDSTVLGVAAAFFVACLIIIFLVFILKKASGYTKVLSTTKKLDSTLYGSSDWQTPADINKNYKKINWNDAPNIDDAQGFMVNNYIDKAGDFYINRVPQTHCLVIATTRSGKTKNFISPNIQYLCRCQNKPSLFITDPKGELYTDNSALLKEQGYNIFVFNLRDPGKSHRYNPLGVVWDFYQKWRETGDSAFRDEAEALLREIASVIAPIQGGDTTWDKGSQSIIQGLCLGLLEDSEDPRFGVTKEKFNLWQILNILNQGRESLRDFCLRRPKTSEARTRLLQYVENEAKETIGSFLVSTTNSLQPYVDFGMTALMSSTDLELDDLDKKPYAIFCIVPDNNQSRHPLATLFTSQIYKYLVYLANNNSKAGGKEELSNEFFFILEEFGNFPKMECIEQMLSIGGGRRIWTAIVLQSLSQIKKIYGKDTSDTILNNIQLQIYMGTTENDTNKYFSEFFGSKTVNKTSLQIASANNLIKDLSGSSGAEKAVLIQPDELSRLQPGEIVFKLFRHQPARGKLMPIYSPQLKNKVWREGSYSFIWQKHSFDREKLYYDLIKRDNIYDIVSGSVDGEFIFDSPEFYQSDDPQDHVDFESNSKIDTKKESYLDIIKRKSKDK